MTTKFKGILEISNEEYHAERAHLSSSNYKTLLKDPELFYKEKILGQTRAEVSQQTQNNYDEGNYAHTLLLEPELADSQYKIFPDWVKRGAAWELFKAENKGNIILSKPQYVKVHKWVAASQKLPVVKHLLSGGKAELSLFGEFLGVPTKVRADYINVDKKYIVDVKTTAYPTDLTSFRHTATGGLMYQLSAALYLSLFEQYYGGEFDFYFVVLGKKDYTCDVYKLSNETREAGEAMLFKAVKLYKELMINKSSNKSESPVETMVATSSDEYEVKEI